MNKCNYCDKHIDKKDTIVQCPDCMKLYHSKCIQERIIESETITGRITKAKVKYYKCPNCGKEIWKSNRTK